jgi:hypothetical protein
MSTLSEVTLLIGQRAGDLEKAREIFRAETRSFVSGILGGIRRLRSEPWTTPRVRIDLPREIDTEAKATGDLNSQFANARCDLRFKKGTNYQVVGEIKFGIEYHDPADAFAWQITLVPSARYQRIDDKVWAQWRSAVGAALPPESAHHDQYRALRAAAGRQGPDAGSRVQRRQAGPGVHADRGRARGGRRRARSARGRRGRRLDDCMANAGCPRPSRAPNIVRAESSTPE